MFTNAWNWLFARRYRWLILVAVLILVGLYAQWRHRSASPTVASAPASTISPAAMVADNIGNLRGKGEDFSRGSQMAFMNASEAEVLRLIEAFLGPDAEKASEALANTNSEFAKNALRKATNDSRSSVSVWSFRTLRRISGEDTRDKVEKIETKVDEAIKTSDRAEIKANSAVKIARDAETKAESATQAAKEALESSQVANKMLTAMGEKLAETKEELEIKIQAESKARAKWDKAKAKAKADAEKIRVAEANRVRISVLKAVEDKAAEAKKVADSLRTDLIEETTTRSQLASKIRWMEKRIAEQKRTVEKAEAEAKATAEAAEMTYVTPTCSSFRRSRCR